MQKLKNEKGITLIALVITIAVLSIISVPVLVNMSNIKEFDTYSGFKEDIDILREAISIAYFDKDIGTIGPKYEGNLDFLEETQNEEKIKNENDNDVYYAININRVNEKLSVNMETLNNGAGNKSISSSDVKYSGTNDVYIINEQSRTIYYVKGISYKEKTYHRLSEQFSTAEIGVEIGVEVKDFNKTYKDKDGNKAKIPVGYKVSENENEQIISKGLVISDNNGNEFVWIPVQNFKLEKGKKVSIEFGRHTFGTQTENGRDAESESIKIKNGSTNDYFYEIKNSFEAVSAIENGGFYIGRYVAGTTSARSSSSGTSEQVNVKKGLNVYNYVTKNQAVSLAEGYANNNSNFKSRLCSSYAWDTILKFIESTENTEYLTKSATGTAITKTGSNSINNIYDFGYNTYEWTTESSSNSSSACTIRGGVSSSESPITRKSQSNVGANNIGFRIALFLNVE